MPQSGHVPCHSLTLHLAPSLLGTLHPFPSIPPLFLYAALIHSQPSSHSLSWVSTEKSSLKKRGPGGVLSACCPSSLFDCFQVQHHAVHETGSPLKVGTVLNSSTLLFQPPSCAWYRGYAQSMHTERLLKERTQTMGLYFVFEICYLGFFSLSQKGIYKLSAANLRFWPDPLCWIFHLPCRIYSLLFCTLFGALRD